MARGLKGLAGDTVWYGVSSILARLINYLLVPLYTSPFVFNPEEYGIMTELYAYVGFLYVVYTYGMETAYFRFATAKSEEKDVFNICFSALLVSSLIFSSLLVGFSSNIVAYLGYQGQEETIYYLAAIIAIDSMVAIPYARLRLQNKAKKFALIKLFNVGLTVLLNLFFYVFCLRVVQGTWFPELQDMISNHFDMDFKVKYVFLANMMANASVLVFLFNELKGFRLTISLNRLKPLFLYAVPLLVMGLAGITNEMLSRALLKEWLPDNFYPGQTSLEALGVFGACYKLSVFMMLGIQAFRYAAEPFFFSEAEKKDSPELFAKIMSGFVIFNSIVFLAVSINLEPISWLFLKSPAYHEGLYIVPFLLLGYFFNGIYYNLSIWYKITDNTKYGAMITGVGALATVVLNYTLIPTIGYFGSAVTTLVTFFGMAMVNYLLGQKHYPIPYNTKQAIEYILIASLLVAFMFRLDLEHWLVNMIVKNLSVLAFVGYVYWREREHIKGRKILGFKIP